MKNKLIPLLLIIAVFAGCTSKQGGDTNTDSNGGAQAKAPHYESITTQIMPPQVVSGQAGATTVKLLQANGNNVHFFVLFLGAATQTVTIDGKQFASNQNGWADTIVSGSAPQTISFTPQVNSANYTNVVSTPVASGPNTQGLDVTVYSDNAGDAATIYIQDMGLSQPNK